MRRTSSTPGRKPRRLYLRLAVFPVAVEESPRRPADLKRLARALDAAGRFVAHGELTDPPGDLLIVRARDRAQAERLLRADPYRGRPDVRYEVLDWRAERVGAGVNIEPPPARGSGRLTQLHSVAVVVRDLARAAAWYREVLGLSVLRDDPETGYLLLGLGQGSTAISLVSPRRDWGEPYYSETVARIGTATGLTFRTDSVGALELRLRHAGARVTQAVSTEPWGRRVVRFSDPDGNEFLAFEDRAVPGGRATALPVTVPGRARGSGTTGPRA